MPRFSVLKSEGTEAADVDSQSRTGQQSHLLCLRDVHSIVNISEHFANPSTSEVALPFIFGEPGRVDPEETTY